MLTYSILFINIYIHTHTSRALINELILIQADSRALIESSRVYTSLHCLIIDPRFRVHE
jgi:hypothetical protein